MNYFSGYGENSFGFWPFWPIAFIVLGVAIYGIAFGLVFHFMGKRQLFLNKALYVVFGFAGMLVLVYPLALYASPIIEATVKEVNGKEETILNLVGLNYFGAFGLSVKTAVGSFAFQWPEEITSVWTIGDQALVMVFSGVNFGFLSFAVVESVVHAFLGFSRNYFHGLARVVAHYYLFTDLPYKDIKDFLAELKKKKDISITMVFAREDMFCEDPTFLRDQINALDIHTQIAKVGDEYFKGLFHKLKKNKMIYVYSFFEDDKDNLTLAKHVRSGLMQHVIHQRQLQKVKDDAIKNLGQYSLDPKDVLIDGTKTFHNDPKINGLFDIIENVEKEKEKNKKFKVEPYVKAEIDKAIKEGTVQYSDGQAFKSTMRVIRAKKMLNEFLDRFNGVDAFISYQDSSIVDNFGADKSCCGHVHYYSEYENVAEKFVFNHPITDFMRKNALREYQRIAEYDTGTHNEETEKRKDIDEILKMVGPIYFDFLGFGNVNQAMFREMASSYQLPGDKACYWGKAKENEAIVEKYIYAVNYTVYSLGQDKEIPELNALRQSMPEIYNKDMRLINIRGLSLDISTSEGLKSFVKDLHLENGDIHNIIISLGDSEQNMTIAFTLRNLLYQEMTKNKREDYLNMASNEQYKAPSFDPSFSHIRIYAYVKESGLYNDLCVNAIKEEGTWLEKRRRARRKKKRSEEETRLFESEGFEKPIIDMEEEATKLHVYNAFSEENSLFKQESKMEKGVVPIFVFGRNGRFWNQQDRALLHMASGCSDSYESPVQLNATTFSIRPDYKVPQTQKAIRNLYFKFSDSSPSDQDENYDAALGIKAKLALLGYRLSEPGLIQGHRPCKLNGNDLMGVFNPRIDQHRRLSDLKPILQAMDEEEKEKYIKDQKELYLALFTNNRSETANMIATMEHNRWVARQIVSGKLSARDAIAGLNKTMSLGDAAKRKIDIPEKKHTIGHACICSNSSLIKMEEELYDIRVKLAERSTTSDVFQSGVFKDYVTCYWNDVGALLYVINLIPKIGEEKIVDKEEAFVPTFAIYSYKDLFPEKKKEEQK